MNTTSPNTIPRCLWLVDSAIIVSETFLLQSLKDLRACCEVKAFSGAKGSRNDAGLELLGFSHAPISLFTTLCKKLLHQDLVSSRRVRQAKTSLSPHIERFKPHFAWIHFGTTVAQVWQLLYDRKIPFFIQVHGIDVTTRFNDAAYKQIFVRAANQSISVICSSQHIKRLCILAGVYPEKLTVIPNALNEALLERSLQVKTLHPSFVHLGRLTEKKHPIATLHAFHLVKRDIPKATLKFIGDGPLMDTLKQRTEQLALNECVTFTGALSHEQALHELGEAWVYCQHSVTSSSGDQEGFANSIAEAGLLKIPCVSTLHNGIPEHVMDGETGFLVREFNFEEMANRMIQLASDTKLREKLGQNAQLHYSLNYSQEKRAMLIKSLILQHFNHEQVKDA